MKKIAPFLIILCFFIGYSFTNNRENVKRPRRVLVYTKNGKGYVHANIAANIEAIFALGKKNDFLVDTSTNPSVFTEKNLSQYSAIIFGNTNNDIFDNDAQRLELMRYVQAGGGIVGIHSATGAERNWKWYIQMIGGTFLKHPPYQKYSLKIIDKANECMKGMPETWIKEDECYYFKSISLDLKVLMVVDLSTLNDPEKPDWFGDIFPSVWCHEFQGGRVWYTALGHNPDDYKDPVYLTHLKNGINYAIGKNKALDYSKAFAKEVR
jgi:uncharacterized protein